jgi:hypothetical protein
MTAAAADETREHQHVAPRLLDPHEDPEAGSQKTPFRRRPVIAAAEPTHFNARTAGLSVKGSSGPPLRDPSSAGARRARVRSGAARRSDQIVGGCISRIAQAANRGAFELEFGAVLMQPPASGTSCSPGASQADQDAPPAAAESSRMYWCNWLSSSVMSAVQCGPGFAVLAAQGTAAPRKEVFLQKRLAAWSASNARQHPGSFNVRAARVWSAWWMWGAEAAWILLRG